VSDLELASLLDDVRRELGDAVEDLARSRAEHRRVESLLLAVLEHVPVPIIVVDAELRVRAVGAAAEQAWGATLDRPLSSLDALDHAGLVEAVRTAFDAGHVQAASLPDGFGAALIEEPGTGARYIAIWAG
jgi:PAS domain-containing protein